MSHNPLNLIGGIVTKEKATILEKEGFQLGESVGTQFRRVEYVDEDIPIDLRATLIPK